jgi:excinuclease ABC subunit A
MSVEELIIEGARQNNLKSINLRLPHDKVIAVTGVSGSGKSSLAFDTIFAEGQWRFIESLSTYARLFLEKMDRPEVDLIENIRPAIALEQRNPVRGSRTTVGTLTEIYDFLRLIYSKTATPYCPKCGAEIRSWDPSAIKSELLDAHGGGKCIITFPSKLNANELRKRGFKRIYREGEVVDLDDVEGKASPPFEVVLDRLVIKDEPRLSDSIEMALGEGGGKLKAVIIDGPSLVFISKNACDRCEVELPEPSPLLFSFNHPIGACPECKGFGNVLRYDEELIVPDRHLSLSEGAIEPWEKPAARWWKRQMLDWAERAEVPLDVPYSKLPKKHRTMLFGGDAGFLGVNDFFEDLESIRYKLHVRVFLSRYRKGITCPACYGKRLQPGALGFKLSGMDISEVTAFPINELLKFLKNMEISPFKKDVIKEPLRQIDQKLEFLKRVGLDYLTLSREGKTLSGGEYQRINLSNQLAADLTGTLYVLDEPTVGLHKRDTDRISEIMGELSGTGNTIVVVEHDKGVIESAGWIVELGPGGGHLGGEVVFSGPMKDFMRSDTLTAKYIKGEESLAPRRTRRKPDGKLVLKGASGNNLKNLDLAIPLGTLTCVTGVSGSGKSSLVVETLFKGLAKKLRMSAGTPLEFRSSSARLTDMSF